MLQPRMLGGDLLPFAVARSELLEVLQLFFNAGALGFALREVLLGLVRQGLQPFPASKAGGYLKNQRFGTGVGIEQRALCRRAQQRLVLVLAVDVDEKFAGRLELRERRLAAVDEAA